MPSSQKDFVTVLDSPPSRGNSIPRETRLSKEPKSESPEPQAPDHSFIIPKTVVDAQPPHPKPSVSSAQPSESQARRLKTPEGSLQESVSIAASENKLPNSCHSTDLSLAGRSREKLTQAQTSPRDIYEPAISDPESSQELPQLPNVKQSSLHRPQNFKPKPFSQLNNTLRSDRSHSLTTPDIGELPFDWPRSGAQRGEVIKNGSDKLRTRRQTSNAVDMQRQHTLSSSLDTLVAEDPAQRRLETEYGAIKGLIRKGEDVKRISENAACVHAENSMKATTEPNSSSQIVNTTSDPINPSSSLEITTENSRNQSVSATLKKNNVDQSQSEEVGSYRGAVKAVQQPNLNTAKCKQGEQGKERSRAGIRGKKSQKCLEEGDEAEVRETQALVIDKFARDKDPERKSKSQLIADKRDHKVLENKSKPHLVANKTASKELEKKSKDEEAHERARVIRANLEKDKNIIFEAVRIKKERKMARQKSTKNQLSSNDVAEIKSQSVERSSQGNGNPEPSISLESQSLLPSALRGSHSNSRSTASSSPSLSRRVTFADTLTEHPTKTTPKTSMQLNEKHNHQEPASLLSSEKEVSGSCAREPKNPSTPHKGADRNRSSSQKADSHAKVQSKLNITRRVEKGKGRILDQPLPIKPATSDHITKLPDESRSVTKSELPPLPLDDNAGPSKRRSSSISSLIEASKKGEKRSSPTVDKSTHHSHQQEVQGTATLGIAELERASTNSRSRSKSTSRSPAREIVSSSGSSSYESESDLQDVDEDEERSSSIPSQVVTPTTFQQHDLLHAKGSSSINKIEAPPKYASSGLSSLSGVDSEDEYEDESEEEHRCSSTSNKGDQSGAGRKESGALLKGVSKTSETDETETSAFSAKVKGHKPSQPSHLTLSSSKQSTPVLERSLSAGAEDEAGRQLQREARQSIEPSQSQSSATRKKVEPERSSYPSNGDATKTHQAPASTFRPTNRAFPSLSGLKAKTLSTGSNRQLSRPVPDSTLPLKRDLEGNSKVKETTVSDQSSTGSSSESDSTDEDDENDSNRAVHGKRANGMQGLLKSRL